MQILLGLHQSASVGGHAGGEATVVELAWLVEVLALVVEELGVVLAHRHLETLVPLGFREKIVHILFLGFGH